MMKQYFRKRKNGQLRPRGAIVITTNKDFSHFNMGWSLCMNIDPFKREIATDMAIDRMKDSASVPLFNPDQVKAKINEVPMTMRPLARSMVLRLIASRLKG